MEDKLPDYPNPAPEVATYLHAMGELTAAKLAEAIQTGYSDSWRCTANDVAGLAGYLRWATPLRYLGDHYVLRGWSRQRPRNFEILVSPDATFAISVAGGDAATGDPDRMPSTSLERGPVTQQAVAGNCDQISFDPLVHPEFGNRPAPKMLTWLLLHYFDKEANEIRLELSLPVEFTPRKKIDQTTADHGAVTRFEPRLYLPSILLAPTVEVMDEDDSDEEIDFKVERRS